MPTGYTAALCDGEMSFEDFVWRLARGMGAFVMMRDDPLDAKIPERFEPSDYSLKAVTADAKELSRVEAMTSAETGEAALTEYRKTKQDFDEANKRTDVVRDRLLRMRSKVADWKPPTPGHQSFKNFMIEQLDSTIRFDGNTFLSVPLQKSGGQWRNDKIEQLKHDIEYHTKHYAEEVERTEDRNRWIADLRSSL